MEKSDSGCTSYSEYLVWISFTGGDFLTNERKKELIEIY